MAQYDLSVLGSYLNYSTEVYINKSSSLIDTNHIILFMQDATTLDGFVQTFAINTSTWAVTTVSTQLEFNTTNGKFNSCAKVDTNHFINFFDGGSAQPTCQVFTVNTTTWAVTTANSPLVFDTTGQNVTHTCTKIDTNHFIDFYVGVSVDGFCQVITVNTTTWACTTASNRLEFKDADTITNSMTSCLIDTNHVFQVYRRSDSDGVAQIYTINTTTWDVTTASAILDFMANGGSGDNCFKFDTNHIIDVCFTYTTQGLLNVNVFTVNTTTWAVTTAAAIQTFIPDGSAAGFVEPKCQVVDSNHFVVVFGRNGSNSNWAQVFTVNTSTWAVATTGASLIFNTFNSAVKNPNIVKIDTSHYTIFWPGEDAKANAQILSVEGLPLGPVNLKSYNTNLKANIKTINTNPIANIKTLDTNA